MPRLILFLLAAALLAGDLATLSGLRLAWAAEGLSGYPLP